MTRVEPVAEGALAACPTSAAGSSTKRPLSTGPLGTGLLGKWIGWASLSVWATVGLAVPVGAAAYLLNGATGLKVCLGSAGLCLAGAVLGRLLALAPGLRDNPLVRCLAGMALRAGVPLLACVALSVTGGVWMDFGGPFYLLPFYGLLLALDAWDMSHVLATPASPTAHRTTRSADSRET